MRFYRLNLNTDVEYEAIRASVDNQIGYSGSLTCISPYATAPLDQKGRVLLSLTDNQPGYDALLSAFSALVLVKKAKELTQDEYDASFFPAPSGGGGVSSFNDLTDKPTTLSGYGITDGVATSDARLTDARTPTGAAGGDLTGTFPSPTIANGAVTLAKSTGLQKTITVSSAAPTGGTSGDLYVQTSVAGQVTPATLTADQNDYAPGAGDIYRISSNAARNITGWLAWTDGTVKLLVNVGANNITLKHQSTSSSASNRFIVQWAGDFAIGPGGSAIIFWDATDSRVRVF